MKLIVGIGNFGLQYQNTKHNVGFEVIERYRKSNNISLKNTPKFTSLLGSCDFNGEKILLCEPLTYVNLSGEAIKKIMDYYKIEIKDLLVIVDDVNLDLGRIRIRQSGSAGGHNGLKNIINYLGEEFYRVRVGVGKNSQIILSDYVLSKFSAEELSIINPALNECGIIMEEFMAGLTIEKIMLNHNK